jgi:hypothetical protein
MASLPVGYYFLGSILAKRAPAAKRIYSFKRHSPRTRPFGSLLSAGCSKHEHNTREERDPPRSRTPGTVRRRLAVRAASRPNLLARRGLRLRLGLLSRPVRAQSYRWHKVEHLRPQSARDGATGVAHEDVVAVGASNAALLMQVISATSFCCI